VVGARPNGLLPSLSTGLLLTCLVAAQAGAQDIPGIVTDCWEDTRLFESLAAGPLDYCRGHLRYVPGALDCYRVIDRVCTVYLPATGEWTDTRYLGAKIPFPCPAGPSPPVCRRLDLH
jgi:hypothetical protein